MTPRPCRGPASSSSTISLVTRRTSPARSTTPHVRPRCGRRRRGFGHGLRAGESGPRAPWCRGHLAGGPPPVELVQASSAAGVATERRHAPRLTEAVTAARERQGSRRPRRGGVGHPGTRRRRTAVDTGPPVAAHAVRGMVVSCVTGHRYRAAGDGQGFHRPASPSLMAAGCSADRPTQRTFRATSARGRTPSCQGADWCRKGRAKVIPDRPVSRETSATR